MGKVLTFLEAFHIYKCYNNVAYIKPRAVLSDVRQECLHRASCPEKRSF